MHADPYVNPELPGLLLLSLSITSVLTAGLVQGNTFTAAVCYLFIVSSCLGLGNQLSGAAPALAHQGFRISLWLLIIIALSVVGYDIVKPSEGEADSKLVFKAPMNVWHVPANISVPVVQASQYPVCGLRWGEGGSLTAFDISIFSDAAYAEDNANAEDVIVQAMGGTEAQRLRKDENWRLRYGQCCKESKTHDLNECTKDPVRNSALVETTLCNCLRQRDTSKNFGCCCRRRVHLSLLA